MSTDIPLTDQYIESITKNEKLLNDYGFIRDGAARLKSIVRKGCGCNWGHKVRAVIEQIRTSFLAMPAEDIVKVKKILGVENRNFVAYRRTVKGNERKTV
jgi:hypothetical protein